MPPPLKCCARCFGDRDLEKSIIPAMSNERGNCSFCGSVDVLLVPPSELADVFGSLINIYSPDDNGRLLVEWLREDWGMFHPSMDNARAKELLAEVLDDGEIVRKTVSPPSDVQSEALENWENLRAELMHQNRYFPDAKFNLDRLRDLLDYVQADDIPTTWFRARLQPSSGAIELNDMGAPPPRIASHGRANPAGIPYLYMGSSLQTAVSEIRPHTGELACVAQFTIKPGLRMVDLRAPRKLISPFVLSDEDAIALMRSDIGFLERLGQELTRPVVPQGAPFDYVPSQYLCEFIKKCGYAGVLYGSSVSDGINLALFTPGMATPVSKSDHKIVRVQVEVSAP